MPAPSARTKPSPAAGTRAVREAVLAGPVLVVMMGAAGSGKSTLAAQAATAGPQVLSLDALRLAVSDDESDQSATADAVALLHALAEARLRRGLTVIVDATNAEASARQPLLALAARHGVPSVAAVMMAGVQACLERNAARPGPRPGARWGRRVPDSTVRAQHDMIRQALPGLAAEGFARVIDCPPDRHLAPR
ncbi:MAG: AAA family ATPase [Streptosporangiales bacterium]|nr:AAA family ATPase [Streptosporangiales bacterium]